MKQELPVYYNISSKMEKLNDMYSMCSGLLSSNPTEQNIKSCNIVFFEIKENHTLLKENCPYISFYLEYLK